jgi:hypothetical protein
VDVTFSIYQSQSDAAPLWQETQTLQLDEQGRYTALLGTLSAQGLPLDLFTSGEARWLGVAAGSLPEQPRVLLVSVPYALKAGDAETLAGKPATAYQLAPSTSSDSSSTGGVVAVGASAATMPQASTQQTTQRATTLLTGSTTVTTAGGTVGYLPLWDSSSDITNSALFQNTSTGYLGIGTVAPRAALDIRGQAVGGFGAMSTSGTTDWNDASNAQSGGGYTLLMGNAANGPGPAHYFHPFSFEYNQKDGTGNMTQFAVPYYTNYGDGGNNIWMRSRYWGSWLGWRKVLSEDVNGNVGIGTTAPGAKLETALGSFSNSSTATAGLLTSGDVAGDPGHMGVRYTLNNSTANYAGFVRAVRTSGTTFIGLEIGSETNHGIRFLTAGTGDSAERMRIDASGNVGIGTTSPAATLEVNGTTKFDSTVTFASGQTFTGNGSGLTNLNPANLTSGTAGINIAGNAVTATNAANSTSLGGFAAGYYARLDTANSFTGNQTITGSVGIQTTPSNRLTVLGAASQAAVKGIGVSTSAQGASTFGSSTAGLWGDADSGIGVAASADAYLALFAANNQTSLYGPWYATLTAYNYSNSRYGIAAAIGGSSAHCIFDAVGSYNCPGTKSARVPLADGRKVLLYTIESPEVWFEDFGSGTLAGGVATIALDALFADTVNAETQYHVFLTPLGDCEGLYIASQSSKGFEVRELRGGKSNVSFDYRIVAHRKGYEDRRLDDATNLDNVAVAGQSVAR